MSRVVALRSVEFGTYVSMNGIGITHHCEEPYKDTIKVAEHVQSLETFYPLRNPDGTFSFESTEFPNVFLTLNGHGVPPGTAIHGGGGYAAAQYTATAWEKFYIIKQDVIPGHFIECAAFRGRYLRIGGGLTPKVVNIQGVAGIGERIEIVNLDV